MRYSVAKNSRQKQRPASILVSVLAMFTMFFIFCGFAIDFAMVVAARSQLQNAVETAALGSVANTATSGAVNRAKELFEYSKTNLIKHARVDVTVKTAKKAILVEGRSPARVYFLNILGINYVDIHAQAAAQLKTQNLSPDTSLGVPHHAQFIAPDYIFDKAGNEIRVTRAINSSAILVYVGLNDAKGSTSTKWVNVTCSSSNPSGLVQEFNINANCVKNQYSGSVTAARFIRVINDTNTITPLNVSVALINTATLIKRSTYNSL